MKFPGRRKSKHYFPVTDQRRQSFDHRPADAHVYIVGIDQLLVDVEARVEDSVLQDLGIPKGQSIVLDDASVDRVYAQLKAQDRIIGEYAGGSGGNTLHNYSVLADDHSYLLGCITQHITVGDYAFHYIRNTSSRVDLENLQPVDGPMGRAICFVTDDGERSFGISRGIMDALEPDSVKEELIAGAGALVLTAYLLRDEKAPIYKATLRAIELANRHDVPVVLSLGTTALVEQRRDFLVKLIDEKVQVLAGNLSEVAMLTGEADALLAGQKTLDWCDMVLLTRDKEGLYLCAYVDAELARETQDPIHSKSIGEYNRYEYSRAMLRTHCAEPIHIFSHINPYLGGADIKTSTNGAGDAALAALLHDMAATRYHSKVAPTSPKHSDDFLTYSSIHQICKYANRVSYEVLCRSAPRLMQSLPEREDSLEESYWSA